MAVVVRYIAQALLNGVWLPLFPETSLEESESAFDTSNWLNFQGLDFIPVSPVHPHLPGTEDLIRSYQPPVQRGCRPTGARGDNFPIYLLPSCRLKVVPLRTVLHLLNPRGPREGSGRFFSYMRYISGEIDMDAAYKALRENLVS